MAIVAGAEKVLVASATASAAATIDITSGIDSTYDEYELHLIGIRPSVDSINCDILFSTDGLSVPTYVSAGGGTTAMTTNTLTEGILFYVPAAGGYVTLVHSTGPTYRPGNAAGESISGIVRFYSPTSTSVKRTFQSVNVYTTAGGIVKITVHESAADSVAAAIDSLRVAPSSGNLTGELRLYGIVKSV